MYRAYIEIMEKRLETTIVFLGFRVGFFQGLGFRLFRVQGLGKMEKR